METDTIQTQRTERTDDAPWCILPGETSVGEVIELGLGDDDEAWERAISRGLLALLLMGFFSGCFSIRAFVGGPSKPVPQGVRVGDAVSMGSRTVRLVSYSGTAFHVLTDSIVRHFADEPLNEEEDKLVIALTVLNDARAYRAGWNWRHANIMEWGEREFLIVYDTP